MMKWLRGLWYARLRRIDLQILWPACKEQAARTERQLDHAKAAFAHHAFHDKAWLFLGDAEIARRIDGLK